MKDKECIMIYPYDSNMTDILRSTRFCNKYHNIYLCSMKGWGLVGKNAGEADKGSPIKGKKVEGSFEECLDNIDTVIFVESDKEILKGRFIYPQMYKAALAGKNIVDLLEKNDVEQEIERFCMECNVGYTSFRRNNNIIQINDYVKRIGLVDIDVPIIVVAGETVNSKKFSVQYGIKEELENRGYNVVLVGSKSYCEFLGDISFPSFMFRNEFSDIEQVLMFNRFIKKVENDKEPDAIILGIPGGMITCTESLYGDFGIAAYKTFQAITADFLIFNLLYEDYYKSFFDEMKTFINNRFSCNIDMFHLCNRHIDWEKVETIKPEKIPFLSLSKDSVKDGVKKMADGENDIPIVYSYNSNDVKKITDIVISKLGKKEEKVRF